MIKIIAACGAGVNSSHQIKNALEKELKARLDVHESAIVDVLRRLMEIIDPPACAEPPRKQIGFVKERRAAYRAARRRSRT